ncbi:hypothetical protein MmazTMA_24460 [Methanosarcina mazei]|nr:hypothetical protein MmazTMA_24460 [Methanosarcina mazei]
MNDLLNNKLNFDSQISTYNQDLLAVIYSRLNDNKQPQMVVNSHK